MTVLRGPYPTTRQKLAPIRGTVLGVPPVPPGPGIAVIDRGQKTPDNHEHPPSAAPGPRPVACACQTFQVFPIPWIGIPYVAVFVQLLHWDQRLGQPAQEIL